MKYLELLQPQVKGPQYKEDIKFLEFLEVSPKGPWLVGGAARKLFYGLHQDADWDIAFGSYAQKTHLEYFILEETGTLRTIFDDTYKASSYNLMDRQVQLTSFIGTTVESVMDRYFPLTVSGFAFDGEKFIVAEEALGAVNSNTLTANLSRTEPIRGNIMAHIHKYMEKGFSPPDSSIFKDLS